MSDVLKPNIEIDDPLDVTDDEESATRTTAPEPKTRIEKLLVKIVRSLGAGAEGIADVAQTLGIADKSEFTYPPVSITHALKELAVFSGAAESVDEISESTVPEVLAFIAENGESIVYPEPSGTKTITTNGTHDVKDYASAEVNVPASAVVSGSISITENGTYDVTEKASAVVNVPATPSFPAVKVMNSTGNAVQFERIHATGVGAGKYSNGNIQNGQTWKTAGFADSAYPTKITTYFSLVFSTQAIAESMEVVAQGFTNTTVIVTAVSNNRLLVWATVNLADIDDENAKLVIQSASIH